MQKQKFNRQNIDNLNHGGIVGNLLDFFPGRRELSFFMEEYFEKSTQIVGEVKVGNNLGVSYEQIY